MGVDESGMRNLMVRVGEKKRQAARILNREKRVIVFIEKDSFHNPCT
jgi:ABC-type transport system involved in Fe-S cluster assembly fused permease/ATPase subunit